MDTLDMRTGLVALSARVTMILALYSVSAVAEASLVSATLPTSRAVEVGQPATLFATVINTSTSTLDNCTPALAQQFAGRFDFQTTNAATNELSGEANTGVSIGPGAAQSYVLSLTPQVPLINQTIKFDFACDGVEPAPVVLGLNTLSLSASDIATPDAVAVSASDAGVVRIGGPTGVGAFAIATTNVGAPGQVTFSANTGNSDVPLILTWCQTNISGFCIGGGGGTQVPTTINLATNETATFAIFGAASDAIEFNPEEHRVNAQFTDPEGRRVGETSVAVTAEGFAATPQGAAKLNRRNVTQFAEAIRYFALEGSTNLDDLIDPLFGPDLPVLNLDNTRDTVDCAFGGRVRVEVRRDGAIIDLRYDSCGIEPDFFANGSLLLTIPRLTANSYDSILTYTNFAATIAGQREVRNGTVTVTTTINNGEHTHIASVDMTLDDPATMQRLTADEFRATITHQPYTFNRQQQMTVTNVSGQVTLGRWGTVTLRYDPSRTLAGTIVMEATPGVGAALTLDEEQYFIYFRPVGLYNYELSVPWHRIEDVASFDGINSPPELTIGSATLGSGRGVVARPPEALIIDLRAEFFDPDMDIPKITAEVVRGDAATLDLARVANDRFEVRGTRSGDFVIAFQAEDPHGATSDVRYLSVTVSADFDGDGADDAFDSDDDNDGIADEIDRFPFDPLEWLDSDNDLIGNNRDTDDDNDGTPDESDAYPLNSECSVLNQPGCSLSVLQNFDVLTSSPDGRLFFLELDNQRQQLVTVYNLNTEQVEARLQVGSIDDQRIVQTAVWWEARQQLHLGYDNGDITAVDVTTGEQTNFANIDRIVSVLVDAGDFLFVQSSRVIPINYAVSLQGQTNGFSSNNTDSPNFVFSPSESRVYHLVNGKPGYTYIDPSNGRVSTSNSFATHQFDTYEGWITLEPDGDRLAVSPRHQFALDSLDWMGGIAGGFEQALWTAQGLFTSNSEDLPNNTVRTTINRYSNPLRKENATRYLGSLRQMLPAGDGIWLVLQDASSIRVEKHLPADDIDGDGVPFAVDHYPYEAAAATDSDADGAPDNLLSIDNPTDLIVDAYPLNPLCIRAEDGTGGECSITGGLADFDASRVFSDNERLYLHDPSTDLLLVYNMITGQLEAPVQLGQPGTPITATGFDSSAGLLYIGYGTNEVRILDLGVGATREAEFSAVAYAPDLIVPLGESLLVRDVWTRPSPVQRPGTLLNRAGDVTFRELYFRPVATQFSAQGTLASLDGTGFYNAAHGSLSYFSLDGGTALRRVQQVNLSRSIVFNRPLFLRQAADGGRLIDSYGQVFSTDNLTTVSSALGGLVDALWQTDGSLVVLYESADVSRVGFFTSDLEPLKEETLDGQPVALRAYSGGLIVVSRQANAGGDVGAIQFSRLAD